ncbi:alpha/beta-hydrolase [Penicillium malachiteum]|uniref:Alpha/beta-hydrolase n=1 Tax=Penicillium malachiteum TaxID=1324776 RepID=A0AAD6HBL7_9EURO|nr:alpha/beta-hydrolase [Penicillium malachiteum]
MLPLSTLRLPFGLLLTLVGVVSVMAKEYFNLQSFRIDLSAKVPRMIQQIRETQLPNDPIYIDTGTASGMALSDLKSFQKEWLTQFDWNEEEKTMNNQYTAEIENLTIHFIHQKSGVADAIPLLLLHGWPGSFLEFIPLIDNLTETAQTKSGKSVSFDVIVPSLPGFDFSSTPSIEWTVQDTSPVFNTLMTEVLQYERYALFGTDWGSGIGYDIHRGPLAFIPFYPLSLSELAAENITLTTLEDFDEEVTTTWSNSGTGYFSEQTTKVS